MVISEYVKANRRIDLGRVDSWSAVPLEGSCGKLGLWTAERFGSLCGRSLGGEHVGVKSPWKNQEDHREKWIARLSVILNSAFPGYQAQKSIFFAGHLPL